MTDSKKYRILQGSGVGGVYVGSLHGAKLQATRYQGDPRVPVVIYEEIIESDVLDRIGELLELLKEVREARCTGKPKWRARTVKRSGGDWRAVTRD